MTELRIVPDMPARKQQMYDAADAFCTLPGGIGTMEEFFEVLTWGYLGLHPKPMGLVNVSGYYDPLLTFLDRADRARPVPAECARAARGAARMRVCWTDSCRRPRCRT